MVFGPRMAAENQELPTAKGTFHCPVWELKAQGVKLRLWGPEKPSQSTCPGKTAAKSLKDE